MPEMQAGCRRGWLSGVSVCEGVVGLQGGGAF